MMNLTILSLVSKRLRRQPKKICGSCLVQSTRSPTICRLGHARNPVKPLFSTNGGRQRRAVLHASPVSPAVSARWTIGCGAAREDGGTDSP